MSEAKVIVGLSHGAEEPERATVAYLTAGAALDRGSETVMWLTIEAVRLATKGYVDQIVAEGAPPAQNLHQQFTAKGGRFYVCPVCWKARGLEESELVESAELKGASPLLEFGEGAAQVFSY